MIRRNWVPPDHRFLAVEKDGRKHEHICHGPEKDLRERLEARKLKVLWIKPEPFSVWQKRAARATRKAVNAYNKGETIGFSQAIWQDLKWHLLELFNFKCAYCESKIVHIDYGSVEHYRPKGGVEEDPTHPGYFWLAYHYKNMLPSCNMCNTPPAKGTHFPVIGARSRHYHSWANEKALLLHPGNAQMNPFEHLEFTKIGEVQPRGASPYGQESINWYRLNRFGLDEKRCNASAQVQTDLSTGIIQKDMKSALSDLHSRITLGDREYSAAQLWELERITEEWVSALQGIPRL